MQSRLRLAHLYWLAGRRRTREPLSQKTPGLALGTSSRIVAHRFRSRPQTPQRSRPEEPLSEGLPIPTEIPASAGLGLSARRQSFVCLLPTTGSGGFPARVLGRA